MALNTDLSVFFLEEEEGSAVEGEEAAFEVVFVDVSFDPFLFRFLLGVSTETASGDGGVEVM